MHDLQYGPTIDERIRVLRDLARRAGSGRQHRRTRLLRGRRTTR